MTAAAIATLALVPPFAAACLRTLSGSFPTRLAAFALASSIGVSVLALMTWTFDQPSFADLALCLALMTVPGTILFALVLERWL